MEQLQHCDRDALQLIMLHLLPTLVEYVICYYGIWSTIPTVFFMRQIFHTILAGYFQRDNFEQVVQI